MKNLKMSRRELLALVAAAPVWAQQNRPPRPFPEEQEPTSERGRRLARIARSLNIQRGVVFAERPQRRLSLDIYAPRQRAAKPGPALLYTRLAAWRSESSALRIDLDGLVPAPTPTLYPPVMVPRGFVVFCAQVRNSAEAPFPAQIYDCKRAFHWIVTHAAEFGVDPNRIAVLGASSSAHLAALLAVTDGKDGLDDPDGGSHVAARVRAACCSAGMYDFEHYQRSLGDGSLLPQVEQFLGGTYAAAPQQFRRASPVRYVTADDPPFLVIHGKQDRRIPFDQGGLFRDALRRAGVPVEFLAVANWQHGPIPGKDPQPATEEIDDKIYRFFARYA